MNNLKRNLPPMTSLLAFEAAARLGSFSDAARELNVTREAVSRQIRALETHLGLSLFDRTANGTELRSWGRSYYEAVHATLVQIARLSIAIGGDTTAPPPDAAPEDPVDGDAPLILIVDDVPENVRRIYDVLRDSFQVVAHTDPERAMEWLRGGGRPDLIMLDVSMAEIDGYSLCRWIKADPDHARVPVMFLTSLDGAEDETEGFAAGACDYISRPFVPAILLARIRVQLDLRSTSAALESLLQHRADRLERAEALLGDLSQRLASYQL